jgi:hypothetical protein
VRLTSLGNTTVLLELEGGPPARPVRSDRGVVANAAELAPDVRVDVLQPGRSLELPARIDPA